MHALAVGTALANNAGGDFHAGDASLGLFLIGSQLLDHIVGDMNAGHILVHKLCHAGGLGNDDAQLHRLAELLGLLHEGNELLGLEHGLGLEVLGTGHDLALHLGQLRVHGVGAGGHNGTLGELGRLTHQGVAGQVHALFQLAHGVQQRHGIQVEHGLGTGVVAHLGVVAGEAQDVVNAQHGGTQQLGLQGDAVAVPAGQLQNGGQSGVLQGHTHRQAAHTHDGGLVIGDIDSGNIAEVFLGLGQQVVNVDALGGAYFGGHNKFAIVESFGQFHLSVTP